MHKKKKKKKKIDRKYVFPKGESGKPESAAESGKRKVESQKPGGKCQVE